MCISAARLGPERVSEEVDVLRRSHGWRVQRVCTEDQVAGVDQDAQGDNDDNQDAEGDNDDIYIKMQCVFVTKNEHFLLGVSCNRLSPP